MMMFANHTKVSENPANCWGNSGCTLRIDQKLRQFVGKLGRVSVIPCYDDGYAIQNRFGKCRGMSGNSGALGGWRTDPGLASFLPAATVANHPIRRSLQRLTLAFRRILPIVMMLGLPRDISELSRPSCVGEFVHLLAVIKSWTEVL
jgi:hypothetical protein